MNREPQLHRRLRWLTWFFIIGLVVSGATAMPLVTEVDWLVDALGAKSAYASNHPASFLHWDRWLLKVHEALQSANESAPFLFYGTDWLAFGHFVIAIAFVGALRDPVRNRWLFDFGLIACVLVIPFALVCGAVRGIPFWWRLIDCSFGVGGFVPLWFCRKWSKELENLDKEAKKP
jgi:hypothetical protein